MTPPKLPWLEWDLGDRVVVRYRADDGVHDALGILLDAQPDYVVIRARRGDIHVDAATMMTGRLVEKNPLPGSPTSY